MHAKNTFAIMKEQGCDIFTSLDPAQRKKARASIVALILATDMQSHATKQKLLEGQQVRAS